MIHMTIGVVSAVRLVLLFLGLSILTLCAETFNAASAHQRRRPQVFSGSLNFTQTPRIREDATLILSIRSNLPETIHARIQFRFPYGVSPRSPDFFNRLYFSPYAAAQNFSALINVQKPGVYPLQASIYAGLSNGKTVVEHFYTYLRVTSGHTQVSAVPFNEPVGNLPLNTNVRVRAFPGPPGELTIRGSVVYFNDNKEKEIPIHRPQVALYLEIPEGNDIKIDETTADDRGEYIFENLNPLEVDRGNSRNLYVVVRFNNSVLSIQNPAAKVYEFASETARNVPDGETTINLSIDAKNPNRALANIFNTVQFPHAFLLNRLGWERDRPVHVVWPGVENISYYVPHLIGDRVSSETINIAYGDSWTRIIMFHEYGHAVMTAAYGYDYASVPKGMYQGPHRLETVSDASFAFNEGWAAFMEAAVDNRALNVTGYVNEAVPNIESNQWWTGHVEGLGSNTKGESVEGTVASILWDIFDTVETIDHLPASDDDGISDRTDLLWEILVNEKPQSITEVAAGWRKHGFPMLKALEEIYIAHHTMFRINVAPSFQFASPNADGAVSNESFHIIWDADDPDDNDFTIALYYDRDNRPGGSILIQTGLSSDHTGLTWDTSAIAEGTYYLRAVVMDAHNLPIEVYSRGTVTVDRTPLLPPTITSNTHPDFNRWYAHNSPQIELRTTPSVIPGRQYSFILNRMPESVPDTRPEALTRSNALVFTGLSDGIWWVHVRARDALGYWTDPSHFGFKIDNTPPPIVSNLHWLANEVENAREITLEWNAADDTSGITAYHVQIDVNSSDFQEDMLLEYTVDGSTARYTFTGEFGATYYARIKAENKANLSSRDWSAITPGLLLTEPYVPDVNGDAVIDISDLVAVAKFFGKSTDQIAHTYVDVDRNGQVDIDDLLLVATNFGDSANAAPSLVRTVHKSTRVGFVTRQLTQSAAGHANYMDVDLTRVQKALMEFHRQPHLSAGARTALNALTSWLEAAEELANLNPELPILTRTRMLPVYPNPFNPEAWIPFELAAPADVEIEIYTTSGQLVRLLTVGLQPAGLYHRRDNAPHWDGRNETGDLVGSGVYFYVMRITNINGEEHTYVRKMVLLK